MGITTKIGQLWDRKQLVFKKDWILWDNKERPKHILTQRREHTVMSETWKPVYSWVGGWKRNIELRNISLWFSGYPDSVGAWLSPQSWPQIRLIIGWPLPQVLHMHCPCSSGDKIDSRLKVWWPSWCPSPIGSLAWLQRMVCSGIVSSLLAVLIGLTPLDFWEFLLH